MTLPQRKKGTPRPAETYRFARRNAAHDTARTTRPAGVSRQWWRPWEGVRPTGYLDPSLRPPKVVWRGVPPAPVRIPRTPSRRYPSGWRSAAEREARHVLVGGQR